MYLRNKITNNAPIINTHPRPVSVKYPSNSHLHTHTQIIYFMRYYYYYYKK